MRVIVAGAVAWGDGEAIRRELAKFPADTVVIHGDCAGADAIAGRVAEQPGFAVEAMAKNASDRSRHGREAWKGLNERMLASGAGGDTRVPRGFRSEWGSKHLAELAATASVEVRVFANSLITLLPLRLLLLARRGPGSPARSCRRARSAGPRRRTSSSARSSSFTIWSRSAVPARNRAPSPPPASPRRASARTRP